MAPEPDGATDPPARLRVGVQLDSRRIRRWQAVLLSEIERAPFCDLVVFAPEDPPSATRRRPGGRDLAGSTSEARTLLYRAYERADRRRFGSAADSLAPVSLDAWSRGSRARRIAVSPSATSDPSEPDLEIIAREQLDVLICSEGGRGRHGLARCARYGAWQLCVGDAPGRRPGAPLFHELELGESVAVTTLRALTADDGERVIYRARAQADRLSLHRSRQTSYAKAARLPLRCLRELHRGGWDEISARPDYAERPTPEDEPRALPTNAEMVRFGSRIARRMLRRRLEGRLFEEEWYVAYRRRLPPGRPDAEAAFTTVAPPPGRFYADPFVIRREGRHYLFFEDYIRSARRGVISFLEIDEHGRHSVPRVVLERDYHLSYPFVFSEGDTVFLVPETRRHGTIELYRATSFPTEWELERVLVDGIDACDSTLLRHDGRLWLFTAVALDGGPPLDELFLFSSDSLLGDWEPHPMNPVVSDVRSARPAGRIFSHGGRLIRPAQDCSREYGWRTVLNRIERLDERGYREVPVGRIEPSPRSATLRTHSYDCDDAYEVVDGLRLRPTLPLPRARARGRSRVEHFGIGLDPVSPL